MSQACNSASECRRGAQPYLIKSSPNTYWLPMNSSFPVPRSQAVEAALPLLIKQLKLAGFRSHWQPLSQQAEAEGWRQGHAGHQHQTCDDARNSRPSWKSINSWKPAKGKVMITLEN